MNRCGGGSHVMFCVVGFLNNCTVPNVFPAVSVSICKCFGSCDVFPKCLVLVFCWLALFSVFCHSHVSYLNVQIGTLNIPTF
jgi:hypothetical protein